MKGAKIIFAAAAVLCCVALIVGYAQNRSRQPANWESIAKVLFLADFKRNYAALNEFTKEAAEPEEYAAVLAKAEFMNDNLDYMLFSYHCCKLQIQADFIPAELVVPMDDYYDAYRAYVSALTQYLQENTSVSQEVHEKLNHLADVLPTNVPYQMTVFFRMDQDDTYLLKQQLNGFSDSMRDVVSCIQQENSNGIA